MGKEKFFFKHLEKYKDAVALVTEDENEIIYQELIIRADQLAKQMKHESLIFLVCRNVEEAVIGYVGCLRNDIIPVMISEDIDERLLKNLLNMYHPSYIWEPEKSSFFIGEKIYQDNKYCLRETGLEKDYELGKDLSILLTTSGSTGSPKLVRQTWKNIQSNTESIVAYLNILPLDRAITTLPMNYTYGLSILNTHLYVGARVILTEKTLFDKSFWNLFINQKATTFGGVPYTYEILKKLQFRRMELPSLRYITQAGGKLVKEMTEEFNEICEEKKIQLIIMYGQTEATARMSYLPWKDARKKAGSIGIAIPGGRFVLINEDGNEIQNENEVGELIYFGDNVTPGYAESRMDLAKSDENCGKLYTGDMAKRDEDGFFYIVGRKKRFLKLFGNRVNLDEVENLLKKEKIENVCTGKDDCLVIYITNLEQEKMTIDFIINHTRINRNGFVVRYIKQIPRSESGKVLYSSLEVN